MEASGILYASGVLTTINAYNYATGAFIRSFAAIPSTIFLSLRIDGDFLYTGTSDIAHRMTRKSQLDLKDALLRLKL